MEGYHLRLDDEWRQTRMLYSIIFNTNSSKQMTAQELIPLDSDRQEVVEQAKEVGLDYKLGVASKYRDIMKTGTHTKVIGNG
jgi:hypothetical protein